MSRKDLISFPPHIKTHSGLEVFPLVYEKADGEGSPPLASKCGHLWSTCSKGKWLIR